MLRHMHNSHYTIHDAKKAGDAIGVDWGRYDLTKLTRGMNFEFENNLHVRMHQSENEDPLGYARVAIAHLQEQSDYYDRRTST